MKKIIYKTETGIAVIHPTGKIKDAMKDIPEGVEYKIIDEKELPKDREFRNAWTYDLKEDIPKSKEIWKQKLRMERQPLFQANDLMLRDAMLEDDSAKQATAIKERDRLRDITKKVDSAKTISAIKKIEL